MTTYALILALAALAFANGANDNFKGVATLYGSGTLRYGTAIALATLATAAGSLVSVALASGLVQAFSGAGLVSDEVASSANFAASVGFSAAITILLATKLGMPTSTTHALTGALLGVALIADGAHTAWPVLAQRFFLPLLLSPLVAIALTALVFRVLRRSHLGVAPAEPMCVCVSTPACAPQPRSAAALATPAPALVVGPLADCERSTGGMAVVARSDRIADATHVLSAASVCFARAVNDTPKVAALLAASGLWNGAWTLGVVALAMALGGLLGSRRVAETMSRRITKLEPVEGLSANLVTAGLVIASSRYGLPVSTTHVSCGSIFGIGLATRSARRDTIARILAAWVTTLPLAAFLGGAIYLLLSTNP